MLRDAITSIVLVAVFVTFGCSSTLIGKQMPDLNYYKISASTRCYGATEHLVYDYKTQVDYPRKKLKISGSIIINENYLSSGWTVENIDFKFYFLDKEKKISGIKTIMLTPSTTHDVPILFDVEINFLENYYYLINSYKMRSTL